MPSVRTGQPTRGRPSFCLPRVGRSGRQEDRRARGDRIRCGRTLDSRTHVRLEWLHCSGGCRPTRFVDSVLTGLFVDVREAVVPMAAVVSAPVADVAAAAGKLRADDGLVTDTGQQLEEIEVLL